MSTEAQAPVAPEKPVGDAPAAAAVEQASGPAPAAPVEAAEPTAAATESTEKAADTAAPVAASSASEKAAEAAADSAPQCAAPETKTENAGTPIQELFKTAKQQGHPEIWGVTLADPDTHVPSQIVFQKYLNANDGDLAKAKEQLVSTLEWRARMRPLELLTKKFSRAKFDGLGYVTSYTSADASAGPEARDVFTWNVYGIVKSMDETFGDLDDFIAWRAALMELALQELGLAAATRPITAADDPYKIYQVHDYKSISFLRQNASVKAASKQTIAVFAQAYPELLKEKFFVNVPAIMGFMYGLMKLFVAPKTIKKFHPMSNGAALASEFADSKVEKLGAKLPKEYGGEGEDLQTQGKAPLLE